MAIIKPSDLWPQAINNWMALCKTTVYGPWLSVEGNIGHSSRVQIILQNAVMHFVFTVLSIGRTWSVWVVVGHNALRYERMHDGRGRTLATWSWSSHKVHVHAVATYTDVQTAWETSFCVYIVNLTQQSWLYAGLVSWPMLALYELQVNKTVNITMDYRQVDIWLNTMSPWKGRASLQHGPCLQGSWPDLAHSVYQYGPFIPCLYHRALCLY